MPKKIDGPHDWSDPPKNWAEKQAHRVALEVRRLRGKRPVQWLADRTREVGSPVTRSVISDLELGRRRYVTTAEVTVLAYALNTRPIALLFPPPYDEQIDIVPGLPALKLAAVEDFCDNHPTVTGLSSPVDAEQNLHPLRVARLIAEWEAKRRDALIRLQSAKKEEDPSVREALEQRYRVEVDWAEQTLEAMKESRDRDGG
ncbi:hypothetical protein [Mycolicibacterium fortuitum]|uniref:Uncharacterized protein n=2 Tax=Mycolicibacterium fortuitum TaxID=1766 RepID=A0AAE4V6H6_MYCFO|nr:hypothetical protein [Mycolicibacterium fortuitum]MCV7138582.1 hypothetical protein [Mycolicibacterium fortuitum]MDV7195765.1 hypothetical protein [Mycolicibacterium fortuitum]MDV7208658.1 hypothetical protein [Mycolicibacterium fortuitum]MDV7230555.1 hypothetical protein [Mycolicibacterium fortuitum]MDV7262834.1 hypothetical protein [Mycolicibacterium fortuitum]